MRRVGRIAEWNDAKGFGFVVPHDGGRRAFVHIKAFQRGSRRPVDADLISYDVVEDGQGRPNATNARFAGQRIATPRTQRRLPRTGIVLAFFALLGVGALAGWLPLVVAPFYGLASALSYFAYRQDKAKAIAGERHRRTPEAHLHLLDLLGGWPGALMAQQRFRHKSAKASFQTFFWMTVVANIGIFAWLAESGLAERFGKFLWGA